MDALAPAREDPGCGPGGRVGRSRTRRRRRIRREWFALVAVLVALVAAAAHGDWFARQDAAFYDSALRLWHRDAAADIVVVAIDDASLERLGRWPWPRAVHAALLPRLREARGVFLDTLMSEAERDSDGDTQLALALREHGRAILPLHSIPAGDIGWLPVYPSDGLAAAACALAHIHVDTDADGLVRRIHLREGPPGQMYAHAALALHQLAVAPVPPASPAGVHPGVARPGPWLRQGEFPIAFAGAPGHFIRLSYAAVLGGEVPPTYFRDKLVLVGATAAGLGDHFATPSNTDGRLMPGVEVNAHILQQLRQGVVIAPPRLPATLAFGVLAVLLAMAANALMSPRARLVATVSLAPLLLMLAAGLLRYGGTWIPPTAALAAVILAYPLWSWRRLEAAQAFLDDELGRLGAALHRRGALPRVIVGDPLEQRIAAIEAADAELQRNRRAREEAISFLSHDMRAPQVSILALAELYRDSRGGRVDDAFWQRLEASARGTLSLAEDFVQITRAEHLDATALVPQNLADLATEAIDDAWPRLEAGRLRSTMSLPEEAWTRADRALLARALRNLIDNAIKHAPPGTRIDLGIEPQDRMWRLWIADQGPGVPDPRKAAIFRRFEVGDGAGAGLGLALVRTAAERFGGSASVEDAPGGGARFVLLLPAVASGA